MAADSSADTTFKDLGLDDWWSQRCKTIGITKPTPVQTNCIPAILRGSDCIAASQTGTGKTLAFALPILQRLWEDLYGIFALVVTPTRELAAQIADQFRVVGGDGTVVSLVVGGQDMMYEGINLSKRPHVVVATPGRLVDHLESCDTFSLKRVKFLVLDEADRLLGGAYDKDLSVIFGALPETRQTLLFSATITDTLKTLQSIAKNETFFWESKAEVITAEHLTHKYVTCGADFRDGYLVEILKKYREENESGSVMIFTKTRKLCQMLSKTLTELGFSNVALHSMLKQKERKVALTNFKSSRVNILVSTDVASRGLDIPLVQLVINHSVPTVPKVYVHRVGRTARAGRSGMAITIITPEDVKLFHAIESLTKATFEEITVKHDEVAKILAQVRLAMRLNELNMEMADVDERKRIHKRKQLLLEGKDPDEEELKLKMKRKEEKKKRKMKWEAEKKARQQKQTENK